MQAATIGCALAVLIVPAALEPRPTSAIVVATGFSAYSEVSAGLAGGVIPAAPVAVAGADAGGFSTAACFGAAARFGAAAGLGAAPGLGAAALLERAALLGAAAGVIAAGFGAVAGVGEAAGLEVASGLGTGTGMVVDDDLGAVAGVGGASGLGATAAVPGSGTGLDAVAGIVVAGAGVDAGEGAAAAGGVPAWLAVAGLLAEGSRLGAAGLVVMRCGTVRTLVAAGLGAVDEPMLTGRDAAACLLLAVFELVPAGLPVAGIEVLRPRDSEWLLSEPPMNVPLASPNTNAAATSATTSNVESFRRPDLSTVWRAS